ncbi:MAG: virulence-associated E family protein, partial [Candidatus Neomarinimicrobiota bacterium]
MTLLPPDDGFLEDDHAAEPLILLPERPLAALHHLTTGQPGTGDWADRLHRTPKGGVRKSLANVLLILRHHPQWQGVIARDVFGGEITTRRLPPTRSTDAPEQRDCQLWTDGDTIRTAAWIADRYSIDVAPQMVEQAVLSVADSQSYHPVREYLQALQWDGQRRLHRWLPDYCGADPASRFVAAVGVAWVASACARVLIPGCQADSMLILEGDQGTRKSSMLRSLVPVREWCSETEITIGDKDSFQALRGRWIQILGELASLRGARDLQRVKSFLSATTDTYRPSYGRRTIAFPRQCVFAGDTNESHYLTDPTGHRRFWPVRCGVINLDALIRDRDQLWAEAHELVRGGGQWWLDSDDEEIARGETADRDEVSVDPWLEMIAEWLDDPIEIEDGIRRRLSLEEGV